MAVDAVGHGVWNYGKKVMKFQVVFESARRPIGFVMSPVRRIVHVVYLFPLSDAKRQTFARQDHVDRSRRIPEPARIGSTGYD